VHTLKLGPVDTPMTVSHKKNALFARPADVARGIVRAIDHGRAEAFVPFFWQLIMPVVRNLPEAVFQRVSALSGR
jgi:short-subunit dehydrogenase